jgi:DNA-binding transcriptional ArsR family regulator
MDDANALERDAAGIGALVDPVRRRLYEFVCAQPGLVSRDQAADAIGIPHHQAKFHLDRLTAEGLLESDYARLTGRSGPGAGRTSKLYRRAPRDIAVSLPQREYELAGRLMATAIARSAGTGEPVAEILNRVAREYGHSIGATEFRGPRRLRPRKTPPPRWRARSGCCADTATSRDSPTARSSSPIARSMLWHRSRRRWRAT